MATPAHGNVGPPGPMGLGFTLEADGRYSVDGITIGSVDCFLCKTKGKGFAWREEEGAVELCLSCIFRQTLFSFASSDFKARLAPSDDKK